MSFLLLKIYKYIVVLIRKAYNKKTKYIYLKSETLELGGERNYGSTKGCKIHYYRVNEDG